MKVKLFFIALSFLMLIFFGFSCVKENEKPVINPKDTTTMKFLKRGLLLDTKTTEGLPEARVSIYAILTPDSNKLIATTKTDSNGFFQLNFVYLKFNPGFQYVFEHTNPVFMKRTYSSNDFQEKINDSTELYYLHRKSVCEISLKNMDGKQKNVMLFNTDKKLNKLIMNLRKDTAFYYLLQDYNDNVFFDYFPQKNLQKLPVRGSTSGDTVKIEFKY